MLILSEMDVVDTLVPALELEPKVAVEDCLDERDIALNCLKLNHRHGPSVQKTVVIRCKRSTQALEGRHWASCWAS